MLPGSIRKSGAFIAFIGGCGLVVMLLAVHAHSRRLADALPQARNLVMVKNLALTDLCLFTEARYTRNPSQADFHAPFQDHPMALDHFPVGSLASQPHNR